MRSTSAPATATSDDDINHRVDLRLDQDDLSRNIRRKVPFASEKALPMAETDLRSLVLRCLQSIAPEVDISHVDPHAAFNEQFDIDSVDYLNFVMAVEEELNIRIAEADYPHMSTLDGCLSLLAKTETRGNSPETP
ncbi:MAG: acyl carrier protein [Rhodospirillales bacterium]|nr:acyl carrier protein [Rhodospirillales bacterium]